MGKWRYKVVIVMTTTTMMMIMQTYVRCHNHCHYFSYSSKPPCGACGRWQLQQQGRRFLRQLSLVQGLHHLRRGSRLLRALRRGTCLQRQLRHLRLAGQLPLHPRGRSRGSCHYPRGSAAAHHTGAIWKCW